MMDADYYRQQAARARRLADAIGNREMQEQLSRIAIDYDDIAADLERGAVEVRHPELMPQRRPSRVMPGGGRSR
jgi:hypothetical protein